MKKISDEFDVLDSSINEDVYHRFLKKHPVSSFSLYAMENYAGYDIDTKKVEPFFENKNFTVLSVSLDQPGKRQAWLNAIHKNNLTWTHVSDLKFWDNAVAKQYGIRAIPQNLLIDPKGKIIAKNIKGEELNKKLEDIFK